MAHAQKPFSLSAKGTSPFKSAGASVQSTTGSRGVRISVSNAGYIVFRGSVRVLATHSIRQFPLHFPSSASPCAIRFQLDSTCTRWHLFPPQHWCLLHSITAKGTAILKCISQPVYATYGMVVYARTVVQFPYLETCGPFNGTGC
jgi:hypothetical protein